MPTWVPHLPSQVGYPAGGSLTADEWKGMALVYCPIVVRHFLVYHSDLEADFLTIDSPCLARMVVVIGS
jgi:hypothetical protein